MQKAKTEPLFTRWDYWISSLCLIFSVVAYAKIFPSPWGIALWLPILASVEWRAKVKYEN